jgi:hypothetical protein
VRFVSLHSNFKRFVADRYAAPNGTPPQIVLLVGPPGSGKSLRTEALTAAFQGEAAAKIDTDWIPDGSQDPALYARVQLDVGGTNVTFPRTPTGGLGRAKLSDRSGQLARFGANPVWVNPNAVFDNLFSGTAVARAAAFERAFPPPMPSKDDVAELPEAAQKRYHDALKAPAGKDAVTRPGTLSHVVAVLSAAIRAKRASIEANETALAAFTGPVETADEAYDAAIDNARLAALERREDDTARIAKAASDTRVTKMTTELEALKPRVEMLQREAATARVAEAGLAWWTAPRTQMWALVRDGVTTADDAVASELRAAVARAKPILDELATASARLRSVQQELADEQQRAKRLIILPALTAEETAELAQRRAQRQAREQRLQRSQQVAQLQGNITRELADIEQMKAVITWAERHAPRLADIGRASVDAKISPYLPAGWRASVDSTNDRWCIAVGEGQPRYTSAGTTERLLLRAAVAASFVEIGLLVLDDDVLSGLTNADMLSLLHRLAVGHGLAVYAATNRGSADVWRHNLAAALPGVDVCVVDTGR